MKQTVQNKRFADLTLDEFAQVMAAALQPIADALAGRPGVNVNGTRTGAKVLDKTNDADGRGQGPDRHAQKEQRPSPKWIPGRL